MSEEMNDLERGLRQLAPTAAATGPILYELGRASAIRSARLWRRVSVASLAASLLLGALLLTRPEPAVRVEIVQVPATPVAPPAPAPLPKRSSEPNEPVASAEAPMPDWRLQQHHVSLRPERVSDPVDDGGSQLARESRPLGVGDAFKGPLYWSSIGEMGER
jgi:hypothetical protein